MRRPSFNVAAIARVFFSRPTTNDDGTLAAGFIQALDQLGEHEAAVIETLRLYPSLVDAQQGKRSPRRSRQIRTLLARPLNGDQRRSLEASRRREHLITGHTRPYDPLTVLCAALHEDGLSATQIVDLLDATGIERRPAAGARERVERRIARAKAPRLRSIPPA